MQAPNGLNGISKTEARFFLSDSLGARVILRNKSIGKLKDLIIIDKDKVAEVTSLVVFRPFGNPGLVVPWSKVVSFSTKEIEIDLESLEPYQSKIPDGCVLLRDHILDKKVLDMEENEVEIVYDLIMLEKNGKLYVTDVDSSKHARLRRLGMGFMARKIETYEEETNNQLIPWFYVQSLPTNISSFKGDVKLKILKDKLADLPPVDLADILEEMDHEQRLAVFNQLDTATASDALEEIDPNVQRALVSSLKKDRVAELIDQMTPGQAADVLGVLPYDQRHEILELMNDDNVEKINAILTKQEENVLNYASHLFVAVPPDTTVEQAQNEYHHMAKKKDVVMYLYVVDKDDKLLGVIDIKELLQANDSERMCDIMIKEVISLNPNDTLHDASNMFNRYEFRAIPVVDDNDRILGVLPYRDVMRLTHHFVQ